MANCARASFLSINSFTGSLVVIWWLYNQDRRIWSRASGQSCAEPQHKGTMDHVRSHPSLRLRDLTGKWKSRFPDPSQQPHSNGTAVAVGVPSVASSSAKQSQDVFDREFYNDADAACRASTTDPDNDVGSKPLGAPGNTEVLSVAEHMPSLDLQMNSSTELAGCKRAYMLVYGAGSWCLPHRFCWFA